ncbi:cardiolipin synthase [Actimicrobium sp. CCC2.4]|uniref:cardiolipin synthase n=1 Tax=Actimicrobium sp. CCC2.4 TaxID=3048606 RepID=UPI002AC9068B|nr:cardiolipin synthase [Actimicrobium sp. CCC2.4]MEB0134830.1 cardiolipin synthase [Actimicrobium sp. CCC2.4]WPX34165.1 cardiolipin synthase [Actimicrobium sp. CCC2.4]
MATARSLLVDLFACASVLTLSACASLPSVHYLDPALTAPRTVSIENSRGNNLSQANVKAMLDRRLRHSDVDLQARAALEEAATGSPLIAGNQVTLLYDGPQTMTAMMAAIKDAKNSINLETYIFDQDELGLRFADLLIAKQIEGVTVNILYDSIGTINTPREFFERMRLAGIRLLEFNPVNPLARSGSWEPNNRDHRKILVVDGRIGFTGGVNISNTYSRSSLFRSKSRAGQQTGWRDTHIRIEGPAVAALQMVFIDGWESQHAGELIDRNYFPRLAPAGERIVRVLASSPDSNHAIYRAYVMAMQQATTSIHLTAAYFVPDVQIVEALKNAAARGVDVKLVLSGATDSGLVRHAGQSFYAQLLAAGVKLYQLKVSVLHAKTAVIDGVWSTVGSTNLDTRSFLHNNEINVIVLGDEFGASMESAFAEDLRGSTEVTIESWGQRPLSDRIKEFAARTLEYWL